MWFRYLQATMQLGEGRLPVQQPCSNPSNYPEILQ
jgi:hypothetical protein